MKRTIHLLVSLALGLTLTLLLLLGVNRQSSSARSPLPAPQSPLATTRYVAPDGTDSGGCDAIAGRCRTPQYAIGQSTAGDEIRVATGVYTQVNVQGTLTQVVYLDKSVDLLGGYSADFSARDPDTYPTVLDAQHVTDTRVIYAAGSITVTIEGFRITGGYLYDLSSYGAGIHVLSATALISGNHVYSNEARTGGGGIYLDHNPSTVQGNQIYDNRVPYPFGSVGGGVGLNYSPATLEGNAIYSNTSSGGGGVNVNYSAAVIRANQILSNTATDNGGGIRVVDDDNVNYQARVGENTIQGNSAQNYGGGVFLTGGTSILEHNLIQHNTVEGQGGGLSIYDTASIVRRNLVQYNIVTGNSSDDGGGGIHSRSGYDDGATLENNVVSDNTLTGGNAKGAGIRFVWGKDHVWHTTVARNTGGDGSGVYLTSIYGHPSDVVMTNTIVATQTVGVYADTDSTAALDYVLWFGNTANTGGPGTMDVSNALSGDPALDADGYHLTPGSWAIDSAVNAGVDDDVDGHTRPQGAGYDLGADELAGAGLVVSKRPSSFILDPGQTVTYTIIVTSSGVGTAFNVGLTDTLPLQQQAIAAVASVGTCSLTAGWGGGATCDLNDLAPGATARVTLTAQTTTTSPSEAVTMRNQADVTAVGTGNSTHADTILQDCHVRVDAVLPEYGNVQAAVDAAASGDTVTVAGVCAGTETRDGLNQVAYVAEDLTLQGGWKPDFTARDLDLYPTTLDALGDGRVLVLTGTQSILVEGLRLTGGDGSNLLGGDLWRDGEGMGGGVYVHAATVTMSDSLIYDNVGSRAGSGYGGGVGAWEAAITLSNNTLRENTGSMDGGYGGGVYAANSNATLTANAILSNTAGSSGGGGGIYLIDSDGAFLTNTVQGNIGGLQAGTGQGGGIYISNNDETGNVVLTGNTIQGNIANLAEDGRGGGAFIYEGAATLSDNTIRDNVATTGDELYDLGQGGGLMVWGCACNVMSNTIQGNTGGTGGIGRGGGVYVTSGDTITLTDNTIFSNTASVNGPGAGGGVYLYNSDNTLTGNLVRYNNPASVAGLDVGGGVYMRSSDPTLTNNVVSDNRLAGGSGAGLYIEDSSPTLLHTTVARNGSTLSAAALTAGGSTGLTAGGSTLSAAGLTAGTGGDGAGVVVTGTSYAAPNLVNTILVSHTVGILVSSGNQATLDGVLWYGNGTNTGGAGALNLTHETSGDPAFESDGYHITSASAAKDNGVDSGVADDIDGDVRPQGYGYDLGVDELAGVAGLAVDKQADDPYLEAGEAVTYSVVVTSTSTTTAQSVHLTDTLPIEQQATGFSSDRGSCTLLIGWGGGLTCDLGDMTLGETAHLTLSAEMTTTQPVSLPLTMRNAVTVTAPGAGRTVYAETYYDACRVRRNGTDYDTVQAAVDAASSGDVIRISGACYGVNDQGGENQHVYVGKSVTLEGGWNEDFTARDPDLYPTTLDPQGQGRVVRVYYWSAIDVTLTGLNLVNGDAAAADPGAWDIVGGGVYAYRARLVISDCLVTGNTAADQGGGIYLTNADDSLLRNNVIQDNATTGLDAGDGGGGLYATGSDDLILRDNQFLDNQGYYGGGLALYSGNLVTVTGSLAQGNTGVSGLFAHPRGCGLYLDAGQDVFLSGNQFLDGAGCQNGGGAYLTDSSDITVHDNLFQENVLEDTGGGGGLYAYSTYPLAVSANRFLSNTGAVSGLGGGMCAFVNAGPINLEDNLFQGNGVGGSGGGLYLSNDAALDGNTFRGNDAGETGGGLYVVTHVTGNGNLFLENSAAQGGGGFYLTSDATLGLDNTVVVGNQLTDSVGCGAGIQLYDDSYRNFTVTLRHTTLSENSGGDGSGLCLNGGHFSTLAMTNTIAVNHTVGITVSLGNTATLNGALWYGNGANTGGAGVFYVSNPLSGAPAFAGDGYHITEASDAVDNGVASGVADDVDGEARDVDPDIGADEYEPSPCITPTGVSVASPPTPTVGIAAAFTATVSPPTATPPLTYTWQATGQPDVVHAAGGLSDTVSFTWNVTGTKTVTVTAENACGVVSDTAHTIVVTFRQDVNGDCEVDVEDVVLVADRWRCASGDVCYDPLYDLDSDGEITVVDIMQVVAHWGDSCS